MNVSSLVPACLLFGTYSFGSNQGDSLFKVGHVRELQPRLEILGFVYDAWIEDLSTVTYSDVETNIAYQPVVENGSYSPLPVGFKCTQGQH